MNDLPADCNDRVEVDGGDLARKKDLGVRRKCGAPVRPRRSSCERNEEMSATTWAWQCPDLFQGPIEFVSLGPSLLEPEGSAACHCMFASKEECVVNTVDSLVTHTLNNPYSPKTHTFLQFPSCWFGGNHPEQTPYSPTTHTFWSVRYGL